MTRHAIRMAGALATPLSTIGTHSGTQCTIADPAMVKSAIAAVCCAPNRPISEANRSPRPSGSSESNRIALSAPDWNASATPSRV